MYIWKPTKFIERMLWCAIIALLIEAVSGNVTERHKREDQSKCPACQYNKDCAAKYQVPRLHTACLQKSPDAEPINLTEDERKAIVKQHNDLRASQTPIPADMLVMAWDDELEMIATRWANQCKKDETGNIMHDLTRFIPGRTSVGQNLAIGYKDFEAAIYFWVDGKRNYDKYFGKELRHLTKEIEYYTQVVWATTSLIGCGKSRCKEGGLYYVCNYAPAGNLLPFISPYTTKGTSPGQLCMTKTTNGLCDCSDLFCQNSATLFVQNCTCSCSAGSVCPLVCSEEDKFHCGMALGFMDNDCDQWYMIVSCPHLCGYCPCSGADYLPKLCASIADFSAGTSTHRQTGRLDFTWLALLLLECLLF